MSQAKAGTIFNTLSEQIQFLLNPVMGLDEAQKLNGKLVKACLEANVHILKGYTEALETVIEAVDGHVEKMDAESSTSKAEKVPVS